MRKMTFKKWMGWVGICALLSFLSGPYAQAQEAVVFEFVDGTALDGADIGASMTTNGVSITTIDIIGQDGSKNSEGAGHKTNIYGSWDALGINDDNTSGNEYGSFDSGEAWVFSFDVDVMLVEIDLAGQNEGAELTISSAAFPDMVLPYVDSAAIHNLSNTLVSAGTEVTFNMTSPTNAADTSLRIKTLTVMPAPESETASGTPYEWLDAYYTGLTAAADYLAAERADSDGDGLTARQEYIAGTIPTNAASVLVGSSAGVAGGYAKVDWQSVTGKCYSVMSSTNLVTPEWTVLANNITGTVSETSYTSTVVAASSAYYKVGVEKRAIYLLIGQSNMAGRAPIEEQDEAPVAGCALFNASGEWEVATNPLNRYSTIRKDISVQQLGPGYGFAQRLRELQPAIHLGLIVNARGGSNISEWEKGSTYYNEALSRVQAALKDGESRLAGIIWHQGEGNSSQTTAYLNALAQLVADFRADLGDPDLPFVAGQVEQDDVTETVKERPVNEYILLLPTVSSNTAVATTEGLVTMDGTHFDSAGQRELGRRFADALLSLQE